MNKEEILELVENKKEAVLEALYVLSSVFSDEEIIIISEKVNSKEVRNIIKTYLI